MLKELVMRFADEPTTLGLAIFMESPGIAVFIVSSSS